MKKSAQPTVINVDRDKLSICTSYHIDPLVYGFSPTTISDLEIVNAQELSVGLRGFIEQNKIKAGPAILILSQSVYFEKNYTGPNAPTAQQLEEFVDTVPFSATSSKLFRVISGYKQVVVNRDFYESLRTAFEEMSFQIMAVVPGFALGQNASSTFSAETCKVIYHRIDQLTTDSIILGAKESAVDSFHHQERMMLESHKVLFVVGTILVILLCAVALYMTFGKPPVKRIPLSNTLIQVAVEPTVVPDPTPAPEEELLTPDELKNLTVQVLNGSGRIGQAASMSALLKSLGFEKIQTGNSTKTSALTILYLSPNVATAAGDLVADRVRTLYPKSEIEVDEQAKSDITIVIGTNTP